MEYPNRLLNYQTQTRFLHLLPNIMVRTVIITIIITLEVIIFLNKKLII
jgi:hypothetical protein